MRDKLLGLAALMLLPATALAHPDPCRWDVFSPTVFFEQIKEDLPVIAVSAVPNQRPSLDVPSGSSLLVKQGTIIGTIEWVSDPRGGRDIMNVYDMSQVLLFQVTHEEYLCRGVDAPGMCEAISITSEQQPFLDGDMSFRIELIPGDYWPHYYRYGVEIGFSEWRHQLMDNYAWLGATLDASRLGRSPTINSPEEQLFWALASDPYVVRYLPALQLVMRNGQPAAYGVVPSNEAYDRIVAAALNAGFWGFQPWMIIDTGLALPGPDTPTISSCEPW